MVLDDFGVRGVLKMTCGWFDLAGVMLPLLAKDGLEVTIVCTVDVVDLHEEPLTMAMAVGEVW